MMLQILRGVGMIAASYHTGTLFLDKNAATPVRRFWYNVAMWLQLRVRKDIPEAGALKSYAPGDWVEIKNVEIAMRWIADGDAVSTEELPTSIFPPSSGVVVLSDHTIAPPAFLKRYAKQLPAQVASAPALPYAHTLITTPQTPGETSQFRRSELVPVGFAQLATWEVAVALWRYDQTAATPGIGTPAEKRKTQAVIRDLRVPLYDTRLVFIKRTPTTELLVERWRDELAAGGDGKLAFLRALYRTPCLVLALPVTWFVPKWDRSDV